MLLNSYKKFVCFCINCRCEKQSFPDNNVQRKKTRNKTSIFYNKEKTNFVCNLACLPDSLLLRKDNGKEIENFIRCEARSGTG